jgi:hypothetical protein
VTAQAGGVSGQAGDIGVGEVSGQQWRASVWTAICCLHAGGPLPITAW